MFATRENGMQAAGTVCFPFFVDIRRTYFVLVTFKLS